MGGPGMSMTDAQKLINLVIDTYGTDAARFAVLGQGDEYAVYVRSTCYFLWSFADWTHYRNVAKAQQKQERYVQRRLTRSAG